MKIVNSKDNKGHGYGLYFYIMAICAKIQIPYMIICAPDFLFCKLFGFPVVGVLTAKVLELFLQKDNEWNMLYFMIAHMVAYLIIYGIIIYVIYRCSNKKGENNVKQ